MALLKPPPPDECETAFSRSLPEFLAQPRKRKRDGPKEEGYVGKPPEVPTLKDIAGASKRVMPHDAQQVFVLGLRDAAENAGIRAATPAGWRVFAGGVRGKTVMGRLAGRREAGWKLTATYYGDRTWEKLQASEALESLPQVREADYELRVLAVPGLNLEAFWLAANTKGFEDLVVPLPPIAGPEGGSKDLDEKVYTMANFLAKIRPLAVLQLSSPYVSA